MDKAFDPKGLVEELKVKGLDVAEEAAKVLVDGVLTWIEKSVVMSENKYDDFALAVIPVLKPVVMKEIDLINGKVDA